jgi:hypothetical protein
MISAGEIYFVPRVKLGKAEYGRPCLVLRASSSEASVCFFSTKFELLRPYEVTLYETDVDFKNSGLREASFIVHTPTPDVPLEFFKGAKLLGHATGEFKRKVENWWGVPID